MFKSICACSVDSLLCLHCGLHNGVVCDESIKIVFLRFEGASGGAKLLDALAEAVLSNQRDDLTAVLLRVLKNDVSLVFHNMIKERNDLPLSC